jgi:uncharacterized membrane protein YhaH (DUF805 family)
MARFRSQKPGHVDFRRVVMDWMILPYRRYFDFSGRSRRKEYWMFALFYVLVIIALAAIMIAGVAGHETDEPPGPVFWVGIAGIMLFLLGSLIPSIAVTVRRFHDQDLSGWMYLLGFIPSIGGIVIIVFMCIEGTKGDNRFGYDPKGKGEAEVFA